ncbi:MAG TPA: hypothetical protein VMH04_23710 [Candidatus Solibacter sp.]|nr:hypothetical protein [Candidatus Solibacter sp.]
MAVSWEKANREPEQVEQEGEDGPTSAAVVDLGGGSFGCDGRRGIFRAPTYPLSR